MTALSKAAASLAAAGALTLVGAAPGIAAPPGPSGIGTSLCQPAPAEEVTVPAGGPLYNFVQPPPAAVTAFERVCGPAPE
jgi:hypothetical protein